MPFKVLALITSHRQFVASIPPELNEVDVLVNNAGLALGMAPLLEYDDVRVLFGQLSSFA